MKYILLALSLISFSSVADDFVCVSNDTEVNITINKTELIDTNEKILAEETTPGVYVSTDSMGTTTYTIHGTSIIMQFDGITKEYTCTKSE